jgi:molybdopterin-guanine dinucleotide biosynthesis protein A
MGRDKAWLPFGGEALLVRVSRIVSSVVPDVTWVARAGQELPPRPTGVAIVRDPVDSQGPLAAVAAALPQVPGDLVFVTACDMPFLQPRLIERLFQLIGAHEACVPEMDGFPMTMCAVYRRSVAAAAGALVAEGSLGMRDLLEAVATRRVDAADLRDADPALESFIGCDTPERYAAAVARLG